ncbi:MAG: radical SAM family heme chaperone HemW [Clostridia bacterium]|nr:radical SAM family heme chaperone HemW [Clostridia bacterium]
MMTTDAFLEKRDTLGLYLHIPFCLSKCRYCDFHSAAASPAVKEQYVAALVRDLAVSASRAKGMTVDTVYVGGGTPTVLPPDVLAAVLKTVRAHYAVSPDAEITVECNPGTYTEGMFEVLAAAGVNRLSIGGQSAVDCELCALGRPHTAAQLAATVAAARAAGIGNINVDLMLGIPHQNMDTLAYTLDAVLSLSPEHISAYGLRVEEGTPFWQERHTLPLADDDTVADMQLAVAARLTAAGYVHYEVSNYAKNQYRSRHNLRYWLGAPYLGFGPGAHSYFGGVRTAIPRDTGAYLDAVERGDFRSLVTERHVLTPHELREEYVMLRMRLFEGIEEADFTARFGVSFEEAYGDLSRLIAGGFVTRRDGRIAFTEKGMYVSNTILSEWLDFSL